MIWLIVVVTLFGGLLLIGAAVAIVWSSKTTATDDREAMSFRAGRYSFHVATESLGMATLGVASLAFSLWTMASWDGGAAEESALVSTPTTQVADSASSSPPDTAVEITSPSTPSSEANASPETTTEVTQTTEPDSLTSTITLTADDAYVLYLNGERLGDSWSTAAEARLSLAPGQRVGLATVAPLDGSVGAVRIEFRRGNAALSLPVDRWETAAADDPTGASEWGSASATSLADVGASAGFDEDNPWLWNEHALPGQIVTFRSTLTSADLDKLGGNGGALDASVVVAGFPTFTADIDNVTIVASWMNPRTFHVELDRGPNVIAVEALNGGGPGGLLVSVEGFDEAASGTDWTVTSSEPATESWRSDPEFQLLNWTQAATAGRDGIASPWSDVIEGPLVDRKASWIWVGGAGRAARQAEMWARFVLEVPG